MKNLCQQMSKVLLRQVKAHSNVKLHFLRNKYIAPMHEGKGLKFVSSS